MTVAIILGVGAVVAAIAQLLLRRNRTIRIAVSVAIFALSLFLAGWGWKMLFG